MDERFHGFQRTVEDWHWWYSVRRQILDRKIARLGLDPTRARLLDVGCGTGGASLVLSRYGHAVAFDRAPESFRISQDRPYRHRVVGSASEPMPFADGTFDVVCALDILEHLDDDGAAASELYRVCRPGGTVIAFVPAFALLWGYNDDYSHHKRRYVESQLRDLFTRSGLEIVESGYFNMLLFLPVLAARVMQRLLPRWGQGMEHDTREGPMNGVLTRIFGLELSLLDRARLPVGTSTFCVGRRPA